MAAVKTLKTLPTQPAHDPQEELLYRFPRSCVNLEIVPDIPGSLKVRLNWQKGKSFFAFLETSALRPLAEAVIQGQRFPIFIATCERRGAGKVALLGERAGVRFIALIEGEGDALTIRWSAEGGEVDALTLHLPVAPGGARAIQAPDSDRALALWRNGVALTAVAAGGGTLGIVERGLTLFAPKSKALGWELKFAPARTEPEVRDALLIHLAERSDRAPVSGAEDVGPFFVGPLMVEALSLLVDTSRFEKPSMDRVFYRESADGRTRLVGGEGTDAARAAGALLAHHYLTGDDALRRHARLLAHGLCDFQVTEVESPHWGAFWDALGPDRRPEDRLGERTLGIAAAARASRGLHVLNAHFETELLMRSALAAAQWLLLKTDVAGLPLAERFESAGPRVAGGSAWAVGETLTALVETFKASGNETYLKAALRSIATLRGRTADGSLRPESAPTECLATTIEGVLMVSREYENPGLIAFARQLGASLRVRREPDGGVGELSDRPATTPLGPSLAAARAALCLARVDDDPSWLLMALRALRAARARFADLSALPIADLAGLASVPLALLLAVGARPDGGVADYDRMRIQRGWQTFQADPATSDYVQVSDLSGNSVDYLCLVCEASLQVMVVVLAPPGVSEVVILKNQRRPIVHNLLSGNREQRCLLAPLGDGREARTGVFVAGT